MNERRNKQHYTPKQKAAFFALFVEHQNNIAAARELVLNSGGTYNWLRKAGLCSHGTPGRGARVDKALYFSLRASGHTRSEAAAQANVHYRTAGDGDRGTRQVENRRYFADGRVVDYTTGMTDYVDPLDPAAARASIAALEHSLDPRFFSLEEREQIHDLSGEGRSIRAIARKVRRAPSTISREIRQNAATTGAYRPYAARRKAAGRRPRPKPRKLAHSGRYVPMCVRNLLSSGPRNRSAVAYA